MKVDSFRFKIIISVILVLMIVGINLLLSIMLYHIETSNTGMQFKSYIDVFIWSMMLYLDVPWKYNDFIPVTDYGKIIYFVIAVLKIIIYAIPTGILAGLLIKYLENRQKFEELKSNQKKLNKAFRRIQCRYTYWRTVPRYLSMTDLQIKLGIGADKIIETVDFSQKSNKEIRYRLRNLADTLNIQHRPQDRLVVEQFPINKVYGCFINRNSNVTIVSTSSVEEAATGTFAFYLAMVGEFNYVSKEVKANPEENFSYYNIDTNYIKSDKNIYHFLNDIKSLKSKWVIFILSSDGKDGRIYPTQFHFLHGAKRGDSSYTDPNITIKQKYINDYDKFYKEISQKLDQRYNLKSDQQMYHSASSCKYIGRHVGDKVNAFTMRIAWSVTCWDDRYMDIIKTIAIDINQYLAKNNRYKIPEDELKEKGYGYKYQYLLSN